MTRRGFSLLEVLFAIGLLAWAGTTLLTMLTHEAMRIASGTRFDEMLTLAEEPLLQAVSEGYSPDETTEPWEEFIDKEGMRTHPDYLWRLVRRVYRPDEVFAGFEADELLRSQAGFAGPYMEVRIEIQRNPPDFPDEPPFALWRIVPPPHPGSSPTQVPTGLPGP